MRILKSLWFLRNTIHGSKHGWSCVAATSLFSVGLYCGTQPPRVSLFLGLELDKPTVDVHVFFWISTTTTTNTFLMPAVHYISLGPPLVTMPCSLRTPRCARSLCSPRCFVTMPCTTLVTTSRTLFEQWLREEPLMITVHMEVSNHPNLFINGDFLK